MMADDWLGLQPPTTCGKRPRSPVDKLADLAATAEDDEQDWRSSKRYLTEVIASGFSRLSFNLGSPQQPQQQPAGVADAAQQQPHNTSPRQAGWLPGQLAAGAPTLQLPDIDCPMDMQTYPPAAAPGQLHQLQQQQQHKHAVRSPSPSSAAGGIFSGPSLQQAGDTGLQGTTGQRGTLLRSTPSPEPTCAADAAAHPTITAAAAAAAGTVEDGDPNSAAPAAAPGCELPGPVGFCPSEASPQSPPGAAHKAGLPPLQTAKVLRAAEKQPNSPSDLPAASLRKVALLRSLLARAEQQFSQQQGCSTPPQQQQQPPLTAGAQQQHMAGVSGGSSSQQHQLHRAGADVPEAPWMQPWSRGAFGLTAPLHQQQQQQLSCPEGVGQQVLAAPRPGTPWDALSSDDMDCSSASSLVDSDGSSSQQCGAEPAAGLQGAGPLGAAASSLLCDEVLFPAVRAEARGEEGVMQQQGYGFRARQYVELPFAQMPGHDHMALMTAAQAAAHPAPQQQQQQQVFQPSLGYDSRQPPHQQQQQQLMSESVTGDDASSSPVLSAARLEELRARALASTNQLTCLTHEDLTSLQLGIHARRGSCCDSQAHSGLQQQGAAPPTALRRHSSHI